MSSEDPVFIDSEQKIKLKVAPEMSADDDPQVKLPGSDLNNDTQLSSQPTDAVRLLKELPSDEFLKLLDQSSPEQLQAFLQALAPDRQPLFQALSKLLSHLINVPDEPRGTFSIIAWWESRRIVFNFIVGLCGVPTLLILYLGGLAHFDLMIAGTIEYGLMANICYTAGWMAELLARSWWKERARHLGPILFSLGFAFSLFLTLAAGFICFLIFLALYLARM